MTGPETLADRMATLRPSWRDYFALTLFAAAVIGMVEGPWIVGLVGRLL